MYSRQPWARVMQSFWLLIVMGFVVCCPSAIAQDQTQLQELWRKKVPEARKQFADFLKSRKSKSYMSSTTSRFLLNGKMRPFHTQQVVKRTGSFWLFSTEGDPDNPINPNNNQCYGFNSKYAFMIKKSKNGKDWAIQNITEVTPDLDENSLFGMKFNVVQVSENGESEGLRAFVNAMFDSLDKSNVSILLLTGTRVAVQRAFALLVFVVTPFVRRR